MEVKQDDFGWQRLDHKDYLTGMPATLLVIDSSINEDYEDAWERPGSSYLSFIAPDMQRLNREEVLELAGYLINWLRTGELSDKEFGPVKRTPNGASHGEPVQ